MTPRQLAGNAYYAARRKRAEAAEDMAIGAMAARADKRDLEKQMRDLQKD